MYSAIKYFVNLSSTPREFGAPRAELLQSAQQTSALRAVSITLRPYWKSLESLLVKLAYCTVCKPNNSILICKYPVIVRWVILNQ